MQKIHEMLEIENVNIDINWCRWMLGFMWSWNDWNSHIIVNLGPIMFYFSWKNWDELDFRRKDYHDDIARKV